MGFENGQHQRKTFATIIGGKFAIKADETTTGAVKRHSEKSGKDVWEIYHEMLKGIITGMELEERSLPDGTKLEQLKVQVEDSGSIFVVNIPVESSFFNGFCAKIKSADIKEPLILRPYAFVGQDGQKQIGMNIYQPAVAVKENKLPYYYGDTDRKGKPAPEKDYDTMDKDEKKIFGIKVRKFYEAEMVALAQTLKAVEPVKAEVNEVPSVDVDSDLPF